MICRAQKHFLGSETRKKLWISTLWGKKVIPILTLLNFLLVLLLSSFETGTGMEFLCSSKLKMKIKTCFSQWGSVFVYRILPTCSPVHASLLETPLLRAGGKSDFRHTFPVVNVLLLYYGMRLRLKTVKGKLSLHVAWRFKLWAWCSNAVFK